MIRMGKTCAVSSWMMSQMDHSFSHILFPTLDESRQWDHTCPAVSYSPSKCCLPPTVTVTRGEEKRMHKHRLQSVECLMPASLWAGRMSICLIGVYSKPSWQHSFQMKENLGLQWQQMVWANSKSLNGIDIFGVTRVLCRLFGDLYWALQYEAPALSLPLRFLLGYRIR